MGTCIWRRVIYMYSDIRGVKGYLVNRDQIKLTRDLKICDVMTYRQFKSDLDI